jgi:2-polyprenyl-6-methoxyphenol hydroxylase-like FAD-dependent oxidoreductase
VVDAEWERLVRSYACGLHPETLRLLDQLGLGQAVASLGNAVDHIAVFRDGRQMAALELDRLAARFPHMLMLPQADLEAALAAALEERGIEILWRHEVTALTLQDHGVAVTAMPKEMISIGYPESPYEQLGGPPEALAATFVIAADGYSSPCRTALGIETINLEQTESFVICEFLADLSGYDHRAAIMLSGDATDAFYPLGGKHGRFVFQAWKGLDRAFSLEQLRELVRERAPWFEPPIRGLHWSTVTHFERLLAGRFGRHRIWLAGDAAHVTGPIGFQSMNHGFIEARELSEIIATALSEPGSIEAALERYDRDQQTRWRRLLGINVEIAASERLPAWQAARLVTCLPAADRDLDALLEQLGLGFVSEGGRAIAAPAP